MRGQRQGQNRGIRPLFALAACSILVISATYYVLSLLSLGQSWKISGPVPQNAQQILSTCRALKQPAGPPPKFHSRAVSDRFEVGTPATLITNATIFTGARNGTEIVYGDILLDGGVVKALGYIPPRVLTKVRAASADIKVVNAQGAWITPGLVDLHSHVGVLSAPFMHGAFDVNSARGPVLPFLRSIDGFNTHDEAFKLGIAGGVTTVQVLPGSGNAIGGQAFMIKLRPTPERSPSSMVVEPPFTLNGTARVDPSLPLRWRHMKQACGENLRRYGTRMDSAWAFRQAYNEARKVKEAQDAYCYKAEHGLWDNIHGVKFPESLQWEMLVDVLRGRVKISNHCYEPVDLDNIVRLSNEFKFPIAAFHHASAAYLVPNVLKRTWGGTPSIAIFSTKHAYKRESYRGSEFAPRVLADNGIPVIMKTDHPIIRERDVLYQAQQAHYFGLPPHLSLASVTSVPARTAGLSHRIGVLQEGADADVVIWDSHPLRLGATPRSVWIDGIQQVPFDNGVGHIDVGKGKDSRKWHHPPRVPNWDEERTATVKYEGLPPLEGKKLKGTVVFKNVKDLWVRSQSGLKKIFTATHTSRDEVASDHKRDDLATVVIQDGRIACIKDKPQACAISVSSDTTVVDLHGGSIIPALMSYGSPLGLEEIAGEPSTGDGAFWDAFRVDTPKVLGDVGGVVRASDALQFSTRHALTAHRSGVTIGTSALSRNNVFAGLNTIVAGLSTTFRTGAMNALDHGAIVEEVTALHVNIGHPAPFAANGGWPSISTQISGLRRLLLGGENKNTETGRWFHQVAKGRIPLVIEVGSADIMATLLELKVEVEKASGSKLRLVFARATEAHLLAKEIADAKVGVILIGARPFPETWDDRRILPGPPITNDTAIVKLMKHGVVVGLGVREPEDARNSYEMISWAALDSNGYISEEQAHALSSINLERLLGLNIDSKSADLVAFEGGSPWELEGKVKAVLSPGREIVEVF